MDDKFQVKGLLVPEEINPFSKQTTTRSTIRTQFCGRIELLNNLNFTCKNNHNTNNPLQFDAPAGIPNHGNSCYLSSALQCLLNIKLLVQCILAIPSHIRKQADFLNLFASFTLSYQNKNFDHIKLYSSLIKIKLGKENKDFIGTKQCDITECLEVILDMLSLDVQELCAKNVLTGPNFIDDLFTYQIGSKDRCKDCKIFEFLWAPSRHFCCDIESGDDDVVSLLKCVRETISLFNNNCQKCTGNPIAMTQWKTVPSIFLFHLGRVKYEKKQQVKIKRKVDLPKTFSIGMQTYALSSISSHIGDSTTNGHYVVDLR